MFGRVKPFYGLILGLMRLCTHDIGRFFFMICSCFLFLVGCSCFLMFIVEIKGVLHDF